MNRPPGNARLGLEGKSVTRLLTDQVSPPRIGDSGREHPEIVVLGLLRFQLSGRDRLLQTRRFINAQFDKRTTPGTAS